VVEHSEHQQITAAGWAYRAKNSGWVIYLDPQTGIWHTRSEAMFIITGTGIRFREENQRIRPTT
jgi:hypothetical protein